VRRTKTSGRHLEEKLMAGAIAHGLHEGSRSEYLAQYAFASWGTAVAIPHQEDHGIDLACTLVERAGRRSVAKWPYTVQVKSGLGPLLFEGEEVEWVVRHPLPFYLCVVHKAQARLSVYHTLPRFYAWSLGKLPDKLEMVPAPVKAGAEGRCTQWPGHYALDLGQPILDFTATQMLDADCWERARRVFEFWVKVENDNLTRVRAGLLKFRMPDGYHTNDDRVRGWVENWLTHAEDEHVATARAHLKECLEWMGNQLNQRGDIKGAARVALLHRHLCPEDRGGSLSRVQQALNGCLGRDGYVYAGVDRLAEVVDGALAGAGRATANVLTTPPLAAAGDESRASGEP
jgi:hypothetical protein